MSIRLLRPALLASLALASGPLFGADQPPGGLHLVGDHWTAWSPPASVPEGVKVRTVAPGDTLWSIAQQELGNPHLWPQIWEKNQYVLDAHWIYPGDPLILDIAVQPAATTEGTGEAAPAGESAPTSGEGSTGSEVAIPVAPAAPDDRFAPAAGGAPVPLGYEDDLYCTGYVGEEGETFPLTLTGSEYQALSPNLEPGSKGATRGVYGVVDAVKYRLDLGDIVYLDGGTGGGLEPGAVLTAVEPAVQIRHPKSRKVVGRLYQFVGRVRVLSVQETTAIGEIVQSCNGMSVGVHLIPFEPEPVPLARRTAVRPVNDPTSAENLAEAPIVLWAHQGAVSIAQDHIVFIDRGFDDNVGPGDIFTIYRENRPGFPPVVLGELAVLSVRQHTATARVLESRFPIYVGDRLEAK